MWASIPLFVFVVIGYNVLVFSFPGVIDQQLFIAKLLSGAEWRFGVADLILVISLIFLYIEIFRATRTSTVSIINHVLSLLVFVACLIEFIVLPQAGTSTFFLIMLMTLIDVIGGFTVTITAARRDIGFNPGGR